MKVEIVNVVATAALSQEVNLEEIRKFEEIFHDSDVYGGRVAYFKAANMQGKVSIFTSGKMISVGTKSEKAASNELNAVKDYLVEKGIISDLSLEPKVRNMVVCFNLEQTLELEDLALEEHVIYEPEQFPGAILRVLEPFKASVLIFSSGKLVITGLTSANQIEPIIEKVKLLVKE